MTDHEYIIRHIKSLIIEIDTNIEILKAKKQGLRELALVKTKIEESLLWLGQYDNKINAINSIKEKESNSIRIYTVYKNAKDRDKIYTVRAWDVLQGTESPQASEIIIESNNYQDIVDYFAGTNLKQLELFLKDDPTIVETWI